LGVLGALGGTGEHREPSGTLERTGRVWGSHGGTGVYWEYWWALESTEGPREH